MLLNEPPSLMAWHSGEPTEPGLYWVRDGGYYLPIGVFVCARQGTGTIKFWLFRRDEILAQTSIDWSATWRWARAEVPV